MLQLQKIEYISGTALQVLKSWVEPGRGGVLVDAVEGLDLAFFCSSIIVLDQH